MSKLSPLAVLPIAKLVLHLVTIRGYGLFRDEYYYVACSRELAWGYVDHPPLAMFLLKLTRSVLGESVIAIRLLPAILGALTVFLVGLITRRLGGGGLAQTLSMTATGLSLLFVFHYFSMNCIDVLIWTLAAYLMVRIADEGTPKLWVAIGVLLGLGLLNKISVLWLGAGLTAGWLATAERRWFKTPWPWAATGITAAIFAPHVIWQVQSGWPTLEFIRNATSEKMAEVSPIDFAVGQLQMMSPVAVPLWLSGLVFLMASRTMRRYRGLGWAYVTIFAILIASGSSRSGYLLASYTWLFAAGGVAWERGLESRPRILRWSVVGLVALGCFATLPFSLPVLAPERYIAYAESFGVQATTEERKEIGELPQHFADMFGWSELVDTVAEAYNSLSPDEQRVTAIFTYNYGNSGAIDYYASTRGLPRSISGHNNYWLWGPRGFTGEIVIVVGATLEDLSPSFDRVEHAGTVTCDYCMPYENNKSVWIARGMRAPLDEVWTAQKHYD